MAQTLDYRIDMSPDSRWKIISADAAAKHSLLYLQEAGLFYSGPGYYTTREGLDSFLIKLTLSGSGTLEYEGQCYTLQAGDVFWIDCKHPQDYRTAPNSDHWHVLWVHFCGANADGYYSLFQNENRHCPVVHLPSGSEVQLILQEILNLYMGDAGGLATDIRCATLLTQLQASCLEAVSATQTEPTPPPTIRAVQQYLQEQFDKPITLDSLSQHFSISKFHLQRTFRQYIGVSPAEFQQRLRMTKAKELLRTTDMPINLVAYTVGIESTSHFISAFRKQEGTTPLKYRAAWSNYQIRGISGK